MGKYLDSLKGLIQESPLSRTDKTDKPPANESTVSNVSSLHGPFCDLNDNSVKFVGASIAGGSDLNEPANTDIPITQSMLLCDGRHQVVDIIRPIAFHLNLDPDDFLACFAYEDIDGIESGVITVSNIKAFARSLIARRAVIPFPPVDMVQCQGCNNWHIDRCRAINPQVIGPDPKRWRRCDTFAKRE